MRQLSLALIYALLITGISIGFALRSAMTAADSVESVRLSLQHEPDPPMETNPRPSSMLGFASEPHRRGRGVE
jgi:hypothetical protein